ncbi:DUF3597 domain-containing protein [Ochrobactrum sp. BTU1]|uniref:DUF3597 domain-containing protein n=1 Tax=Ochrobactrum sp. BTU1 TaxID=2840456 RepID=UPI001C0545C4|nr:DUF3597 domain-containing protein [Ochrobactrum sp. BTU1]
MSVFSSIRNAIFGKAVAAEISEISVVTTENQVTSDTIEQAKPVKPSQQVDVAAVLNRAVASKGQTLHWQTSIVDLMKALDLDSSLTARKALAAEFNFTGDTNDSASMNIWLHKALLRKLADHGGVIPSDLIK